MQKVLKGVVEMTTKTRGKNRGEVKRRCEVIAFFNIKTIAALMQRGLIDYRHETVHGNGYAAKKKGVEVNNSLKGKS